MSMGDTDWRPRMSQDKTENTRRITSPHSIEYYELREYDGGDGTGNQPTGFIVANKQLADEWERSVNGRSYRQMAGILVGRLEDIPAAEDILKRQKALAKLTVEEKKLLGLI